MPPVKVLWGQRDRNTTYATKRATCGEIEEVFGTQPTIRANLRGRVATHVVYPISTEGEEMTAHDDIDPVTGLSLAEMERIAEDLYHHREEVEGDLVVSEPVPEVRSVVSVRFSGPELDRIAAAASEVGQPLSTYIRNAALATADAVDLDAARRQLGTATQALDALRRSLGTAA